jgi:hypothetical protein
MLAPPHSLHVLLRRWCGQMPAPPHCLNWLRVCVCARACVLVCMHKYIYIHVYLRVCVYTCVCVCRERGEREGGREKMPHQRRRRQRLAPRPCACWLRACAVFVARRHRRSVRGLLVYCDTITADLSKAPASVLSTRARFRASS